MCSRFLVIRSRTLFAAEMSPLASLAQPLVARRLVGWSICHALRPHKGHLTSKASLRSPPRDALGEAW